MARRPITKLVDLCEEVGVEHLQVTEVLRRIHRTVLEGNDVIVQEFGTFYRRDSQQRVRVLNDVPHIAPARSTVALRAPRFPSITARASIGFRADPRFESERFVFLEPFSGQSDEATVDTDIVVDSLGGNLSRWNFRLVGSIENLTLIDDVVNFTFVWSYQLTVIFVFGPPGGGPPQFFEFPLMPPEAVNREPLVAGLVIEDQGRTDSDGGNSVIVRLGTVRTGNQDSRSLAVNIRADVDRDSIIATN